MPTTELVFVHGSLISWQGINREGEPRLRFLAARVATGREVRRGFGKWSDTNHR